MQITVSGKQVDLSDALRVHVANHLDVISTKYFDRALEANVTFSRARSFFTCDINVHAARGLTLRGEGEAADAHAAFDDAAEHIAKRLRRYRRRVNEHAREIAGRDRPEAARQYVLQEVYEREDAPPAVNGHIVAEGMPDIGPHATVIAETQTEIDMLSVSEAVMRMDLADQPVLMFRNSANRALNVVYRRSDGNIGWIDSSTAG
ncbi:ribosome hibernation-promoting factor, HPF/YfiA family [Acidiphilium acidophilum]|uniref:Ribosome hibernation promoting factor n=1 Tax=Acidiphilium acidophilum TaxID=76588 RepID=A0AAW9DRT2_ACIAO|nr:ribosome-associated translation inhibitor RaiA [Acidiphilium acidophilum]MDX5931388.1 ribosome-associated translation inhibitor RaiA [Acidiphilium acidophilum]GBR76888.1 30S ribosomal protein S30 [Acidiphilium acidophilum DSM 700]